MPSPFSLTEAVGSSGSSEANTSRALLVASVTGTKVTVIEAIPPGSSTGVLIAPSSNTPSTSSSRRTSLMFSVQSPSLMIWMAWVA